MDPVDRDDGELDDWDPELTERLINGAWSAGKRWFRWDVRDLESLPATGGVMVVSNHSGGMFTPDPFIFASAFYENFGFSRPLYTLGHNALFTGPQANWLRRIGVIRADPGTAVRALESGGVVLVFPGGIYDAYRPTSSENVIDFNGRTGYVRTALSANVPIVPAVSTGGQESQLFLTRGTWLAERLGLKRFRSNILPITLGFPFGFSAIIPMNIPLPTKIVSQVLEPIDLVKRFGDNADIEEVDAHVRSEMQTALTSLASRRRFPILG